MKDLIAGSLGRLDDAGGSKMFAVPRTIYVPPEYEVETDVPGVAEFVTCSLDGRLWIWKRSRRYYVAAFRWNEETERLEFVSTTILSNADIIGRGIDWLLVKTQTNKQIIQALDDTPYIATADLFADSSDTFLYSPILSTEQSQRSDYLQSVNKDYSLLPSVGDWNIVDKFLIRKPDNSLNAYNSMLNIRPLISLELNGTTPIYGSDISITAVKRDGNTELWARGQRYIGKCYILPAVFDADGNPQEYYLYISPDYKVSPNIRNFSSAVSQNDWSKLGIFHTGETVYGFLTEKTDSLVNGLCYLSNTPKLFLPSDNDWLKLLETEQEQIENEEENIDNEQQSGTNTQMFIDTLNNSGLVLHNDGAIFLNGSSDDLSDSLYKCKGLKQWIAPAGNIEAITHSTVISSFNETALAIHTQQGFYRELLTGENLPLTANALTDKSFSIGITEKNNRKNVHVNSIDKENDNIEIVWNDVYKDAVDIDYIGSYTSYKLYADGAPTPNSYIGYYPEFWATGCSYPNSMRNLPVFQSEEVLSQNDFFSRYFWYAYPIFLLNEVASHTEIGYYNGDQWESSSMLGGISKIYTFNSQGGWGGTGSSGWFYWPALSNNVCVQGFFIDPETGDVSPFDMKHSTQSTVKTEKLADGYIDYRWGDHDVTYSHMWVDTQGDKLGFTYSKRTRADGKSNTESIFVPKVTIPSSMLKYVYPDNDKIQKGFSFLNLTDLVSDTEDLNNPISTIFSEKKSQIKFIKSTPDILIEDAWISLMNFNDLSSFDAQHKTFTRTFHVLPVYNDYNEVTVYFFKSTLHPEIFDFNAELERSKLS